MMIERYARSIILCGSYFPNSKLIPALLLLYGMVPTLSAFNAKSCSAVWYPVKKAELYQFSVDNFATSTPIPKIYRFPTEPLHARPKPSFLRRLTPHHAKMFDVCIGEYVVTNTT